MVAPRNRLLSLIVLVILLVSPWLVTHVTAQARDTAGPMRIVSLIPALTEMLFDIGAGKQVVGVGRYDTFPLEVRSLPRVGGLLDPDYEAILRLNPDLVLTYGSQT